MYWVYASLLEYFIIILEIIVISDSATVQLTTAAHLIMTGNCCVGGK